MTHRYQIMRGYKICIQAEICQELINNLRKRHLRYINNNEN